MAEWSVQVAVVAEPYYTPLRDNWVGDVTGTVAIVTSMSAGMPILITKKQGSGFVAAQWGNLIVIGVYFSPNRSVAEFEAFLDDVGVLICQLVPCPVLVVGDFNAKSSAWGSPITDVRGRVLQEWALTTGLTVVNRGEENTCVRQQGGSIVDITLASPAIARRIRGWRVVVEAESLSDHLYIRFDVCPSHVTRTSALHTEMASAPRWAVKQLNVDLLVEAAIVESWSSMSDLPIDVADEARWFRNAMTRVCDAAMPRVRPHSPKKRVYWWSSEIAHLRSLCVAARRRCARYRRLRLGRDPIVEAQKVADYREAKKILQISIKRAKARARDELLETLDGDPWGRPYRMVLGFLRPWAPPITQSLEPRVLSDILSTLFPQRGEFSPPFMASNAMLRCSGNDEVPFVTEAELGTAVERLRAKHTAPGPDGIPGRAWVIAMEALGGRLRRLFNACLESGQFPPQWKVGRLVLLRKEGRPVDSPTAYRPIVLLDEAGKLFERVIAQRLVKHLSTTGPDLSAVQFGFREGRSTIDAILRVKALSEEVVSQGGVLLAVSLDIANAFNSLPWECIKESLRYHRVPPYLCRLLGSYLEGRQVTCVDQDARTHQREISCGVPQGSVLGPLLWNIGYDWVLRGALLPGAFVTCYADDTLVAARGDTVRDAIRLVTVSVAQVVGRIRMLGLEVAINKTEAICFHGPRRAVSSDAHLIISGTRINVTPTIKYLGLMLDTRWKFESHFRQLAPKVMRCASALAGILPNLGGAGAECRSLYMGVVRSMTLYGAPVWHGALTPCSAAILRKLQRLMAIRVIRGYRTVSYEAACLIAGSLPWHLVARSHAEFFTWCAERRAVGGRIAPREKEAKKIHLQQVALRRWSETLVSPSAGLSAIEAIRPVFHDWIGRAFGQLTFRLVQILTGHGCFGKYLHQIAGKEPTPRCHHCVECEVDTAQHTLEECPAWAAERTELVAIVGSDLSLPAVVQSMVGGERSWKALISFCEAVLLKKEEAERGRERAPGASAIRRERTRRVRRRGGSQFHQMPP